VAESGALPWEWAGNESNEQIDGVGTLIISVIDPAGADRILVRTEHPNTNMQHETAALGAALGCVPAGREIRLSAFLDDDLNAEEDEFLSSSFADACMNTPRMLPCTLADGESITATLTLSSQCYHVFNFPNTSSCRLSSPDQ
jgi:hypothetical protein